VAFISICGEKNKEAVGVALRDYNHLSNSCFYLFKKRFYELDNKYYPISVTIGMYCNYKCNLTMGLSKS
jgi:hypothetical protein